MTNNVMVSDLDTDSHMFPFETGIQNILLFGQENVTTYYYNENDEIKTEFVTGSQIEQLMMELLKKMTLEFT